MPQATRSADPAAPRTFHPQFHKGHSPSVRVTATFVALPLSQKLKTLGGAYLTSSGWSSTYLYTFCTVVQPTGTGRPSGPGGMRCVRGAWQQRRSGDNKQCAARMSVCSLMLSLLLARHGLHATTESVVAKTHKESTG